MSGSGLWTSDEGGWQLLAPSGFPDEKTLHQLVEEAPQMLPLAGFPQLVVLGREVQLGSGFADLVAIESTGRPVLIEVKLSKNAEARRAIVSQTLAYAAYLHGSTPEGFEQLLQNHLKSRGYVDISAAASSIEQARSFDIAEFMNSLWHSLSTGAFRLVFVLDEAPEDLVRLVGYLEAITSELSIDLITVSSYEVNGTSVIVPQRVEPERHVVESMQRIPSSKPTKGYESPGYEEFEASIEHAPEENRTLLQAMLAWAIDLEKDGLAKLGTYRGVGRTTLLPRLKDVGAGLITIWNDTGKAYISLWRSLLEKRAPHTFTRLEQHLAPLEIRQGSTIPEINEEILDLLRAAYEEAAAPADVVIVAAGRAHGMYKRHSAYVCQEGRSFREGLKRLGFYTNQAIQPELPQILARRDGLTLVPEASEELRATGDSTDAGFADVIDALLRDQPDQKGDHRQIFLLTPMDDSRTLHLPHPIRHEGQSAWVQAQRYAKSDSLERAPETTSDL